MIERLEDYRDRWAGQEVTLVGCGPTDADYNNLPDQPTICVNESVYQVTRPDRYFFTLHPAKFEPAWEIATWLKWVSVQNPAEPSRYIGINFSWEKGQRLHWQLDKEYCARHNRLAIRYGSLSAAIHFAWFAGAKSVLGVGINPQTAELGYDPRIGDVPPNPHMRFLVARMVEDFTFFNLLVRYL